MRVVIQGWLGLVMLAHVAVATPLQDLLVQYRKGAPALAAEVARTEAFAEQARAAGAFAAPQVGLEWGSKAESPGMSDATMYYGGVSLGQMFMFPGKRAAMRGAEGARASMSRAETDAVARAGALRIAVGYVEIYMMRERRAVLDSTLGVLRTMQEAARRNFETGMSGLEVLYRLQAEEARLRSDSVALAGAERGMATMLVAEMGVDALVVLPRRITFADSLARPWRLDSLLELAQARPEIVAMAAGSSMAEGELRAAGLRKMPDLMVEGRYMVMMGPDEWALMLGVQLPIAPWSRADVTAGEGAARARRTEARSRELAMRQMVRQEVRAAWVRMENAQERWRLAHGERLAAAGLALDAAGNAYRNGKSDLAMVLDAVRMRMMALDDAVMAKGEWLQALLQLEMAAGMDVGGGLPETTVGQE